MAAEQRPVADCDSQRRRQRRQVHALVRRQQCACPADDVAEAACRLAATRREAIEQPAVGVAADGAAADLAQTADHLARLWPARGDIAEADDPAGAVDCCVGEHRV